MHHIHHLLGERMRISCPWLPALGFMLTLGSMTPAAEPYDLLIRQLSAPRYAEREKATQRLVELGEAALPSLRVLLNSKDDETRERASKIITQIEVTGRTKQLLTAPRLRIKFEDKTIAEAMQFVNMTTKLQMSLAENAGVDAKKKISLDTGELPYWEAVETFMKAAGLTEEFASANNQKDVDRAKSIIRRGRKVIPSPEDEQAISPAVSPNPILKLGKSNQPAYLNSSIRIKAVPVNHPQNKVDPVTGKVQFQLLVSPAGGLKINEIVGVDIRQAKTVDGRTLEVIRNTAGSTGQPEVDNIIVNLAPGQRMFLNNLEVKSTIIASQWLSPVTLRSDGLKIRELSELSGVLNAKVMAPRDTLFTIDQVKEANAKKIDLGDGIRVTFTETKTRLTSTAVVRLTMEIDEKSQHMRFNVPFKARNSNMQIERFYGNDSGISPPPDFYLILPSGEMSKATSITASNEESMEDGSRYDLEIVFDNPETWAGVSLIAKGRRLVTVNMPFTLKGVAMPDK